MTIELVIRLSSFGRRCLAFYSFRCVVVESVKNFKRHRHTIKNAMLDISTHKNLNDANESGFRILLDSLLHHIFYRPKAIASARKCSQKNMESGLNVASKFEVHQFQCVKPFVICWLAIQFIAAFCLRGKICFHGLINVIS